LFGMASNGWKLRHFVLYDNHLFWVRLALFNTSYFAAFKTSSVDDSQYGPYKIIRRRE
jgi:hypothetical protein